MEVYFIRANGQHVFLGDAATQEEAFAAMHRVMDAAKYEPPYWRSWIEEDGRTMYDVGSHTEFFYTKAKS